MWVALFEGTACAICYFFLTTRMFALHVETRTGVQGQKANDLNKTNELFHYFALPSSTEEA
jgi:hypothetical protein